MYGQAIYLLPSTRLQVHGTDLHLRQLHNLCYHPSPICAFQDRNPAVMANLDRSGYNINRSSTAITPEQQAAEHAAWLSSLAHDDTHGFQKSRKEPTTDEKWRNRPVEGDPGLNKHDPQHLWRRSVTKQLDGRGNNSQLTRSATSTVSLGDAASTTNDGGTSGPQNSNLDTNRSIPGTFNLPTRPASDGPSTEGI